MNLFIKNIKKLCQTNETGLSAIRGKDLNAMSSIENAWLAVEDGKIADYGSMEDFPAITDWRNLEVIDIEGKYILPTFCDSHTHLVFAAWRETEFVDKIKGLSYEAIAAKGGGILNSAKGLQQTSENTLYELAKERIKEIIQTGTGAVEIKSGYGLTVGDELKMLRVIQRLKTENTIPIKSTFLGAHAFPAAYRENKEAYINLIINEMLPNIHSEKLADYIDAFCEDGFFSIAQTDKILNAATKYNLKVKLHANQLANSGGVQLGIQHNAISVDHLENIGSTEIEALGNSNTIATMLPGAAFFLRLNYPPARDLISANAIVAIATDYNPGSCPNGSMPYMISHACIQMKMTPEEAINASTINGAAAMEVLNEVGSITRGKKANFIITKEMSDLAYLPYRFGGGAIESVYINGEKQ
jgi:imidazolonepropionase